MADIEVGQTVEVKGSGSKPYRIKNCGAGGWSCTCPAWRNQSIDPRIRTCKHIIALRGPDAEQERIGSTQELPSRKPEDGKVKPPVLLAEKWDGETNVAGWWMSEKLDGLRAYWDGRQFISRNGNLFLAPDWFMAGMPSVPLDGELWITRKQFNLAQGIAMSQTRGDEWKQMRYVVYDVPAHGGEFEARLRFLNELLSRTRPAYVSPLEQIQCRDHDHLLAEWERIEQIGGEGLMLRQPGSKYVDGRSSTLLKVKKFIDAEAVVIGHDPGEGRHKGRLGALVARLESGVVFNIGTGFSDQQRENPPPIGSTVMFKYQELTPYGTPRFPVYGGVRLEGVATPVSKTPAPKPPKKAAAVVVPAAPPPPAAKPDLMRRCQYEDGGTKFWEASVTGDVLRITFGTVGEKTSTKEKKYPSSAEARAALDEQLAEKMDDGFTEVDPVTHKSLVAAPAPTPASVPKPAPAPKAVVAPSPAAPAGTRRFEFSEGTSNKFWEVWTKGCDVYTRYGRIGSEGQKTLKNFPSEDAARVAANKLIGEKTRKGYQEVTGDE